jgi:hypothetical protein
MNKDTISLNDIEQVLDLTVKKDRVNKILTFLALLSTYSEDGQLNISFNAPSSSGKTYIPLEVAKLFPKDDIMTLGSASPTAFFHEEGEHDKKTNVITVDLSRKGIIFLDQPNSILLARLRPLLSHDEKIITSKITDKNQKGGNRTKTVKIIGYPSVIFCSAGLNIDEQEATRFILLSPETSQEKIEYSIQKSIKQSQNPESFMEGVLNNPLRLKLQERIEYVKSLKINNILIPEDSDLEEMFRELVGSYKPRNQRDIKHVINIAKAIALLNPDERGLQDGNIYANVEDVVEACELWSHISVSQQFNISPFILDLYYGDIVKPYIEFNKERTVSRGIERKDILNSHYKRTNRALNTNTLRQQIIPMLESAGLLYQEQDTIDKRKFLIVPTKTIYGDKISSE